MLPQVLNKEQSSSPENQLDHQWSLDKFESLDFNGVGIDQNIDFPQRGNSILSHKKQLVKNMKLPNLLHLKKEILNSQRGKTNTGLKRQNINLAVQPQMQFEKQTQNNSGQRNSNIKYVEQKNQRLNNNNRVDINNEKGKKRNSSNFNKIISVPKSKRSISVMPQRIQKFQEQQEKNCNNTYQSTFQAILNQNNSKLGTLNLQQSLLKRRSSSKIDSEQQQQEIQQYSLKNQCKKFNSCQNSPSVYRSVDFSQVQNSQNIFKSNKNNRKELVLEFQNLDNVLEAIKNQKNQLEQRQLFNSKRCKTPLQKKRTKSQYIQQNQIKQQYEQQFKEQNFGINSSIQQNFFGKNNQILNNDVKKQKKQYKKSFYNNSLFGVNLNTNFQSVNNYVRENQFVK